MATFNDLRKAALALPRVYEDQHRCAPAFRVNNKKFALWWPEGRRTIMKLPQPRQIFLFEVRPEIFEPIRIGTVDWSLVELSHLEPDELERLTVEAWSTVVPKSISRPVLAAKNLVLQ